MTNNDKKSITAKKIFSVAGIVFCSAIIFTFVLGVIFELAVPESAFALWAKENISQYLVQTIQQNGCSFLPFNYSHLFYQQASAGYIQKGNDKEQPCKNSSHIT